MNNYDQFWLERNKPTKRVVVKIKRQKSKVETTQKSRKVIVVKKKDLIARGPSTSTPVEKGQDKDKIDFDPEITTSDKWRSQFHYPEDDSESSGYDVKEDDYKFNIEL